MSIAQFKRNRRPGMFSVLVSFWIFVVTAMLSTTSVAAEPIWVFEDPTGQRTYDEVMANPQWFELTSDTTRGLSDSVFWVRVDLLNISTRPVRQVVRFDSIALPEVMEFAQKSQGSQLRSNGYAVPFSLRPLAGISIDFPHLLDPSSSSQVFYRIASPSYKVDLGLTVFNRSDYEPHRGQFTIQSVVIGAFLMLLVYNLFLAVTVRSKIYTIYTLFITSALIIALGFFRYYEHFGILLDPVWLEGRTGVFLYATAFWFLSTLFADEQKPGFKLIGRFYYLLVFAHLLLEPGFQFYVYAHFTGPIIFAVLTYTLLMAVRAGNPVAKFVTAGWMVYIGFSLLFIGNLLGFLDTQYEPYLAYGNLIEGVVGSSVLSYRMRYIVETEKRLKQARYELTRERLASQSGYGYKWELDIGKQLICPDETFATWHGEGWKAGNWYPVDEVFANIPPDWHKHVAEKTATAINAALADPNVIIRARNPIVRADTGATVWVQHYGRLLDEDGRKLLVGISLDVTELMQTQNELESTLDKQKELFAIVGHELRTPVSTIQMLIEDKELSQQERIQQVGEISESLRHVLEDMRVVINPERALEFTPVPANAINIVERALNSLNGLVSERGLTLSRHIRQSDNSNYLIQDQALRQIVTNLVKNAAIHSGGSQIAVAFELSASAAGAQARLQVEDDGKGIRADALDSLFEPFTRGDTTQDGSGLGLYIVQELAERLGGSIEYSQSSLGGACFTLNFPLGEAVKLDAVVEPLNPSVSLEGMQILLAEDDNTLRLLTERMLSAKGAQVTSCVNGKAALEVFDLETFDLVITDLMMPEMDGHELTRAIRATGAKTTIVAVTAAVIGAETEQFIAEGADAVLAKPLRPAQLNEELEKLQEAN